MDSRYFYSTLANDGDIRVLILYPALPTDDEKIIRCTLQAVSLAADPLYSAISYSWAVEDGAAVKNRHILIDRSPMAVTQNLFEGLLRIQNDLNEPLTLWIDAVCINQNDNGEKSRQVSRMADVFRCAEKVIVWLGEGDKENESCDAGAYDILSRLFLPGQNARAAWSIPALDDNLEMVDAWNNVWNARDEDIMCDAVYRALLHANHSVDMRCCPPESPFVHIGCRGCPSGTIYCFRRYLHHPKSLLRAETGKGERRKMVDEYSSEVASVFHDTCKALLLLFRRRYWSRRWIIQEFSLARQMEWRWGRHRLMIDTELLVAHFGHLIDMTQTSILTDKVSNLPEVTDRLRYIRDLCLYSPEHSSGNRKGQKLAGPASAFGCILTDFSNSECTIPHDRLYSLLALCPDFKMAQDYSLTTAEVFTSYARELVSEGCTDKLFQNHEYFQNLKRQMDEPEKPEEAMLTGLPSWVPDFRKCFSMSYKSINDQIRADTLQSDSKTLVCALRCIGVATNVKGWSIGELPVDRKTTLNDYCTLRPLSAHDQCLEHPLGDEYGPLIRGNTVFKNEGSTGWYSCKYHSLLRRMRDGDILCSTDPQYVDLGERYFLVLRWTGDERGSYRIVAITSLDIGSLAREFESYRIDSMGKRKNDQSIGTTPVTVFIV